MTTTEKTCFKCKTVKPLTEFYKHSQMADGHVNKCKDCNKKDVSAHRNMNIDRIREYDKERAKLPNRKALVIKTGAAWRLANSVRRAAQIKLLNAVRGGKVCRPEFCTYCGENKHRIEAHHPDYSRPLLVEWLCVPCHKQAHLSARV